MKRIIAALCSISLLSAAIITIVSCSNTSDNVDDINVPVPFSVPANFDAQLTLAIADSVSYIKYPAIPLALDVNSAIKTQFPAMSANNLKSAKMTQFKIQYKSSVGGTKLDVISNARLYLRTPNSSDVLIATASNNTSGDILNFTADNTVELMDLMKSDQKSFVLEIQGRKLATDQLTVNIDTAFRLLVGL